MVYWIQHYSKSYKLLLNRISFYPEFGLDRFHCICWSKFVLCFYSSGIVNRKRPAPKPSTSKTKMKKKKSNRPLESTHNNNELLANSNLYDFEIRKQGQRRFSINRFLCIQDVSVIVLTFTSSCSIFILSAYKIHYYCIFLGLEYIVCSTVHGRNQTDP
jgi:hypothetical protein